LAIELAVPAVSDVLRGLLRVVEFAWHARTDVMMNSQILRRLEARGPRLEADWRLEPPNRRRPESFGVSGSCERPEPPNRRCPESFGVAGSAGSGVQIRPDRP
jgi:hypothetical protein